MLCFDANDFCVTVDEDDDHEGLSLCFDANDFCVTVLLLIFCGTKKLCFDANDFCVTVSRRFRSTGTRCVLMQMIFV